MWREILENPQIGLCEFHPKSFETSSFWARSCLANTAEIRVEWLAKIAESEAFRAINIIYPIGVRLRGLLTTIRQGFRPILQVVRAAGFRVG